MNNLVLSIFPGIDLLGRAFEEEGFCVVRGPDVLWGGDIRNWHVPAGRFDGVIGGPPCQFASRFRFINPHCGEKHGNLIPEFERIVAEVQPLWFVMENVEGAPLPAVKGYAINSVLLRDCWVGGLQPRKRRISFGWRGEVRPLYIEYVALENPGYQHSVMGDSRPVPVKMVKGGKLKRYSVLAGHDSEVGHRESAGKPMLIEQMCELQGLPRDFMAESPFRKDAQRKLIGNGVPISMGRAIAKAVKEAIDKR
jgi:DNA (cytosine-5)-methyltransferase 1